MYDKKELRTRIGTNIKREREKAGLTQEVLSEQIALETRTLSMIERGNVGISISSLLRICDTLKISPGVILYEQSHHNDVCGIAEKLEQLSPEQYEIANQVLVQLFRAFDLCE